MPKSENQKLKTLYVAKFFLENSDENHAITASDIVDYLREECSIEAERRSIYRDIAILRDEFGMDIDGGQGGRGVPREPESSADGPVWQLPVSAPGGDGDVSAESDHRRE